MQSYKRYGNGLRRFLLGGVLAAVAGVVIVGCTAERRPDGTILITPSFLEDPSMGGVYTEVQINGRCYYTNGEWCHPCGSGPLVRCSELSNFGLAVEALIESFAKRTIDGPAFVAAMADADELFVQDDSTHIDLQRELLQLTGGLTGPEFLAVSGWPATVGVDDTITSPLTIHLYTDDDGLDFVDVAFLWRTDWAQPADVPGVDRYMYIAGDVEDDDLRDLQVLRIAGDRASVAEALEPLRAPGTPVVVTSGSGDSFTF